MRLITEVTEEVKAIISEEAGARNYFVEGPFLQAEIKNRNGRIYPMRVMQREVARYTRDLIEQKRAFGELGHPDSPTLNLPLVSHLITELRQDGNDFHGRAHILSTPNGQIVKSLLDEGCKLGVSSRGLGSIETTSAGHLVGEDFMLATAADIVSDPSAPDAFVKGVMEGKAWVWENGILREHQIAEIKDIIDHAPKKKAAERQLVEAKAFEKFLDAIRVTLTK